MHLRIFLSSPGDVAKERNLAQQVIEQELQKDPSFRGKITCECVRWDDPNAPVTMQATRTPQEAVNRGLPLPSQCDVVIVIFWSRMGTPLPDDYKKPDGNRYLSGTEWEYEEAFSAKPQPNLLVYRRKTKRPFYSDDPNVEESIEQNKRVEGFFQRFQSIDGSVKGGYSEYETPQEFRDRLTFDLRRYINQRLELEKADSNTGRVKAPPPYRTIGKALRQGHLIPIIGGGVSHSGRPADSRWDPGAPAFLPSGIELSRLLAEDADFPSGNRDDLAKISSFYEAFQRRATLRERLREMLHSKGGESLNICPLYHFLAGITTPLLIITTNYDTQIERAFQAVEKPYDLVVYPAADRKDLANAVLWWPHGATEPKTPAPNELDIDLSRTTVIFKMHGSIIPKNDEWDSFVITEEDYVEFISRLSGKSAIPPLFSAYINERSLLFLGYSLRDWNFRVILRNLSRYFARSGGSESEDEIYFWAVQDELSDLEVMLWNKRDVCPYLMDIDKFVKSLQRSMES